MKNKVTKKRKIRIKPKKASKKFANLISRGPNKETQNSSDRGDDEEKGQVKGDKKRVFSPLAGHALIKKLEGATDIEEGTTGLWAMRSMKGLGSVLEQDHPSTSEAVTKEGYAKFLKTPIPKAALKNAAKFRIFWYERLMNADDVILALNSAPPMLSFRMFKGVYGAPKGLVPMPCFWEKSRDNHSVAIVAHDAEKNLFTFVNSWGKEWGDEGFGYLSDQYVKKYLVESWISMIDVRNGQRGVIKKIGQFDFEQLTYRSLVQGRRNFQVIDVYEKGVIAGWAHFRYLSENDLIEIEEIFIMPDFRRKGIARNLLGMIEDVAREVSASKLVGYIHVQDLVTEEIAISIEALFSSERGYEILPYTKRFLGCLYKYEKTIPV